MPKNSGEKKIRKTFPINLSSRSEEKQLKFTDWINAQSNAQNSILSLIEHSIDRFGYVDVTDHDVAKKLYTEILTFNNQTAAKVEQAVISNDDNSFKEEKVKTENPLQQNDLKEEDKKEENDDYEADLNSF